MSKVVLCLSGGQDSVTCAHIALRDYDEVRAVSFNYGQRHGAELEAARLVAARLSIPHETLDILALSQLKGGALTDHGLPVAASGGLGGLPSTFVPMRNLIFLTLAAARAVQWSAGDTTGRPADVMTGVCETDFSGYPDCRRTTMDALELALSRGVDQPVRIVTPLMYLSKAETVRLAERLPGCLESLALSVTCYHGRVPGCGQCPACALRARGFAEAGVTDPALDPSITF